MKDKSKRLTVVNTEKKPSEKKEVQQVIVQPSSSSSSHAPGFNPNLYLLKSVWDSVFEIKTDVSGQKYIFGKLPVVTKYGITMYADDGNVEIPQLAEGLPYDQRTIWFNPETKQIEVIGGTGGGGEGGVSNFWDLSGIPSWITSTKPKYSYSEIEGTPDLSGYATTSAFNAVSTKLNDFLEGSDTDTVINKWKELETFLSGLSESDNLATILTGKADKSYVDTNFVTIAGTEDVTGLHNFVNGLKVGGIELIQKNGNAFLKGNLVVEGGITMYGDGEGGSSVPLYSTLGSLENVDKDAIDAVASVDRVLFQSAGSNVWSWKALSEIGGGSSGGGSVSGDYLPLSGGTLRGAVTFANNTWNPVGDDIAIGDIDVAGFLGLKSLNTARTGIWFYGSSGEDHGALYTDSTILLWRDYPILHSGNYSSYALPLSGGTLTGKVITWSDLINVYASSASANAYISYYSNDGSTYYGDLGFYNDGSPAIWTSSTKWKKLIHEGNISSYNAGSATKLQTARTIWGQSFDGTGNVYGDLVLYAAEGGNMNSEAGKLCFHGMNGFGWGNGCYITGIANGSYGRKRMSFFQSNQLSNTPVWVEVMSILPDGNVGIGTPSPSHKLHVKGVIYSEDVIQGAYLYASAVTPTSNPYENGRLGIFDRNGGFVVQFGTSTKKSGFEVINQAWSNVLFSVSQSGNVTAAGGITMYSDIRKKTKLQDVELSLSQIANAPLIQHYYNSDQNKTTHVGSIAQYWAGLNDWFCKLDNEGFYTMEIQNCALASAISIARHLKKYESNTDKKIRQLKKRISQLEDELELLKKGV